MDPISQADPLSALDRAQRDQAVTQLMAQARQKPVNRAPATAAIRNAEQELNPQELARIDAISQKFEGMVLGQMLKPMFEGLKSDKLFGGGFAEDMYRGMMVSEYGKLMAERGGLGIADAVKRQLLSVQEAAGGQ